jgi:alkyl hydroperoxide reductase subunit AhpC
MPPSIPRERFRGPDPWFARLDRDKSGAITPDDLDWSDRHPWVQMSSMASRLFRRLDGQSGQGDGQLTKDELLQFFDRAAQGKDHITVSDFRDALLGGMSSGFQPGDAPTPAILVRGLFAGEIGSMREGPALEQAAPDFILKTVDGQGTVELAKRVGPKPVVLVFGNFTCGPFRGLYPEVELVHQRWKNDADFVMVYVREAHPTNGWKMSSNERAGVAVAQPTTSDERTKVAEQFCGMLKPTLPVAVDDISDVVGNAYSGMPARLYVIDTQGKVAYKSGRGPFGFRPSEMEQALLMCLLEKLPPQP